MSFLSPGVPNGLSINFQFPFSQRSQFSPSSKIMKSYDKNYFTSTYPFHKHIVRNLPCAKYQRQKDIKPAFICHKVHFWKEKHINCNFELVHQKLYLWFFFLSFLILFFPFSSSTVLFPTQQEQMSLFFPMLSP